MFSPLGNISRKISVVAIVLSIATTFFSCKNRVATVESFTNLDSIPTQTIDSMVAWQIESGVVKGKLYAPKMARYTRGSDPYEVFPESFHVEGYTADGQLESTITADRAVHKTGNNESWEAYGHVVIVNYLKQERMETDTLYWDRVAQKIHTHCFVKLKSPDYYAQGFGMEADERASNAKILRPFDSYGYIKQDSLSNEEKELTSRPNI